MEIDLTDDEIREVSRVKKELTNFLRETVDNVDFKEVSGLAQELVNQSKLNIGFKLLGYDVDNQKLFGALEFLGGKHTKKVDFEIYSTKDKLEFEKEMDKVIDACEPWRKTNPDLVEHETALKERCNSDEPYKPSILFDIKRFGALAATLVGALCCCIILYLIL